MLNISDSVVGFARILANGSVHHAATLRFSAPPSQHPLKLVNKECISSKTSSTALEVPSILSRTLRWAEPRVSKRGEAA